MEPSITSGTVVTIIGMCVCAVLFLASLGGALWLGEDTFERVTGCVAVFVVGVLAAIAFWWGMYPWKSEYHHWTPISGVVDTVDSRTVAVDGGGMEDKFVVKYRGSDLQFGVLDTRAAGLKPGDQLTITCVRIYQWSGTHGYDCNFVSMERAK